MIAVSSDARSGALPRHRVIRLRAIAMMGAAAIALLALSLLSMQVAVERARLAGLDRQVADARLAAARLATELAIRSRPGELLAWNDASLALAPPRVHQYLGGLGQLQTLGRPVPMRPGSL